MYFVAMKIRDGDQTGLVVTESAPKGVYRVGQLLPRRGAVQVRWDTVDGARIVAEAMFQWLMQLEYLPSHAARTRAAIFGTEVLWGLPCQGWSCSASEVRDWYYRLLSGPELRRRMGGQGFQEVEA